MARGWAGGRGIVAAGAMVVLLVGPGSAGAASQVGETFGTGNEFCGDGTALQTGSPGSSYAAPSPGVITSWSYHPSTTFPLVKLKVARSAGGDSYTIVGDSAPQSPMTDQLHTFPARIPVQAGDVIGVYFGTSGFCGRSPSPGYTYHGVGLMDPAPGSTMAYFPGSGIQFEVSALLEPDADNDGFGDETQDQCPTDALTQGACPDTAPPDTMITSGPNAKTRKKSATFVFAGTDARVVTGFECSLDGGAFASCTSPHTVTVKKGKHSFSVRAVDADGNRDGSPATYSWKVKKKKRKK